MHSSGTEVACLCCPVVCQGRSCDLCACTRMQSFSRTTRAGPVLPFMTSTLCCEHHAWHGSLLLRHQVLACPCDACSLVKLQPWPCGQLCTSPHRLVVAQFVSRSTSVLTASWRVLFLCVGWVLQERRQHLPFCWLRESVERSSTMQAR